ncbi:hypothetical protein E0H51_30545 [Rhizobium leguminosarum bv. viciae]|uniref:hypothetical protein n=1 Tax=Rhizobium leguminosarum TaxID=384 RepID=UPI001039FD13|nr:hypothetical protein [Rhizobium leguminosarum]TBY69721.1 hypothetical protein E0H51_30545 [Rhizobium leguminosarum bv. viciae]
MNSSEIWSILPQAALPLSVAAVAWSIYSVVKQYRENAADSAQIRKKLEAVKLELDERKREFQNQLDLNRDELVDIGESLETYVKGLTEELSTKEAEIQTLRDEVERLRTENLRLAGGDNGS